MSQTTRDSKGRFIKGHTVWLGRKLTPEHKAKLSKAKIGRKVSEETRQKMSLAFKGKPRDWRPSEEIRKKMSEARKGIKLSLETRMKIGEAGKGRIPWNKGKKLTEEHLKKISGENAPNWQGGKTAKLQLIRNSVEYKRWRDAIFKRDDYRCFDCGIKNQKGLARTVKINADHIYSFAHYPRLRFELENGQTLCEDCHRKTPNFGVKANMASRKNAKPWTVHAKCPPVSSQ